MVNLLNFFNGFWGIWQLVVVWIYGFLFFFYLMMCWILLWLCLFFETLLWILNYSWECQWLFCFRCHVLFKSGEEIFSCFDGQFAWFFILFLCSGFYFDCLFVSWDSVAIFLWVSWSHWMSVPGGEEDRFGLWWGECRVDGFDLTNRLWWRLPCSWVRIRPRTYFPFFFWPHVGKVWIFNVMLIISVALFSLSVLFQRPYCLLRYGFNTFLFSLIFWFFRMASISLFPFD